VLGNAATGDAFEFGGAYPLLATLAAASVLPGDSRARIDFVSSDYAAKSIVALAASGAIGTFHLASGWHESMTVKEAAAMAALALGRHRGATLLPRVLSWPLRIRGAAFAAASDLLHQGPVFDTFVADLALRPLGIVRAAPATWLGKAVARAEERSWKSTRTNDPQAPARAAAVVSASPEKKFHRIGDVDVAYRDLGEGEPVVLLHGLPGAHSWDAVAERLAAQRRVLIIETLGISDSTGPETADYSLVAQAARVRGLLSALGIARAHVVGNEAGAVIAQWFAVRWPGCVISLVLSNSGVVAPSPLFARSALRQMFYDKNRVTRNLVALLTGTPERRMRLRRYARAIGNADVPGVNELTGPALIVWGGENESRSVSWGRRLADSIPGTRRMEVIPFAGAACHEEQPERFARVVGEFFDEVAGR
jgi:pimeloyl-ACP methyl ester carboxylesterase